jgi:hypothetical protein
MNAIDFVEQASDIVFGVAAASAPFLVWRRSKAGALLAAGGGAAFLLLGLLLVALLSMPLGYGAGFRLVVTLLGTLRVALLYGGGIGGLVLLARGDARQVGAT